MKIDNVIFNFSQEVSDANKNATADASEFLKVEYTSSLGLTNDGEGYFILTTGEEGFSFDDEKQISELFNKIKEQIKPFI